MEISAGELIRDARDRRLGIGIFGIGKSNLGVLDYLSSLGIDFDLTVRSDEAHLTAIPKGAKRVLLSDKAMSDIDEDVLFLSPSVKRDRPELAAALQRGVILSSDAELFFEASENTVFAVTGSDGKSTTTYLISRMLGYGGKDAVPSGNFGKSLASLIGSGSIAVAELSSFQLEYMRPKTKRAVITKITPNHLNWHGDFDSYLRAKKNVIYRTEGLVFDYDSKWCRYIANSHRPFAAVSSALPFSELSRMIKSENYITKAGDSVFLNGEYYFSLSGAIRTEEYNIKNYMMASGAVIGEVPREGIEAAALSFGGLPHRAERIITDRGITYVDSSIDSTPERTLNTISSLFGEVAVIIGGKGKGLSLDELAQKLPKLSSGAALMGEIGEELSAKLQSSEPNYPKKTVTDFTEAIEFLKTTLPNGGTIILSPAATSYDRYRSFEQRGDEFKTTVLNHVK